MVDKMKRVAQNNTPRWVVLVIDILLAALSFGIASLISNILTSQDFKSSLFIVPLLIVLSLRALAFLATKSYTGIIRYTSTQDAVRIFSAVAASSLLILTLEGIYYYFTGISIIKSAVIIIDAFILVFLLSAFRISFKLLYNLYAPYSSTSNTAQKEVIIYGAGEAGIIVKRSFERNTRVGTKIIAFLDNNPKLHGKSVEGVRIYPVDTDFSKLGSNKLNLELVIAINKLSSARKKRIIESCLQHNIKVKTMPPVSAWINGEFNPRSLKAIKIQDLLEREAIQLSTTQINKELKNQTILITGAAGSIGSEIARQCLTFSPKLIILLDQAETPLYDLENELRMGHNIEIIIADVCNTARMEKVFAHFKPAYVFHAAAYKHVPLMEDNPYEAINTNVFGTQNVANLAVKYSSKKFVLISTDKAVNPTNIMGASKRIAEIYVQSLNAKLKLDQSSHTLFVTTRFGNVLGSNGSVIPLFQKQIDNGGPITVTHPEVTRFFMTIPEACQLVLEAGVMGQGGEIYIFDMGESVKIIDLARKMIRLSGLEEDNDIEIQFTGLRPGEKLKEELLNEKENTIGTHNPKIMIAQITEYNYLEINNLIASLYSQKDALTNRHLVETMKKIVPEYKSNNSIYEELDKQFISS